MSIKARFLFITLTVNVILYWTCTSANPTKSLARVLIIQDRSVEDGYKVEIESNGEKRELLLKPVDNIWSNVAQALHVKRDENGDKVLERVNIPSNLKVYHDENTGSVVSVRDGKINGILDSDYMIKSEGEKHYLEKSIFREEQFNTNDYRIVKEYPLKMYPSGQNIDKGNFKSYYRSHNVYTAEISVFVDSRLSEELGSDDEIYKYLTIFWNGVKKRYETFDSPQIVIRLVGCVIIRNSEDEPFISNNKYEDDYLFGGKTLSDGAEWIYENMASLPDHDIMYIQSGLDLIDEDGSTGLGGIAYVRGACRKNGHFIINSESKYLTIALGLGEDVNGKYRGVHTAAHEIAHNLGSPHDNDTDNGTGDCPWDDGYIMSYVGGSINRLFFSECSINKMRQYLEQSEASCTKENLSETKPVGVFTSTNLPGQMITMTEQCKEITGRNDSFVYSNVDPESELCYNLKCVYYEDGNYWLWTTGRRASEGSECPSGKHCDNGQCI